MKTMYILPSEHFGGAERQGILQIRWLKRNGFDVIPVVGPGHLISDELHRVGVHDQIVIDEFPTTDAGHSLADFLPRVGSLVGSHGRSRRALAAIARQHRVDLLFAVRTFGWVVAAALARDVGIPYIVRGGSRPTRPIERFGIRLLTWTYGPPALVVANCEAVRVEIAPRFSAPSLVVENLVDTSRFDPAAAYPRYRQSLGGRRAARVVGLAARPAPGKGFELFVDVVRRVAATCADTQFLVAGEFAFRRHYEEMCRRHGVHNRVTFLGHVSDIENFYVSCDVVVLTSESHSIEGSPNALLEAMSLGRPVVATAVGGVREIIADGVEGFLIEDGDGDHFSGRLIELLESEALRIRLGAAGRRRAVSRNGDHESTSALGPAVTFGLMAGGGQLPGGRRVRQPVSVREPLAAPTPELALK